VAVTLRPMEAADKPAFMALLEATPEFEPAEIPIAEEVLDCYLVSPGRDYQALAAEKDGRFVGYICYGSTPLTESTWDIYWMAVQQSMRGHGVGTALLHEAEERIKTLGGHLVLIETSSKPNYLPTRRFYRRHNYKQISRIKDFYAPGDHLVTFEKRV
jgi:ribosomal protein S18 acetylase RimI-like enzyme